VPLRLQRHQARFGFVAKDRAALQVPIEQLNERSLDAELCVMRSSAQRLCAESMSWSHSVMGGQAERPNTV
jgi:hypothetical protein